MIHYHGTPIGGRKQDTARFLLGRHALIPFFRKDDLGVVAENCQSFVFDNSAFSIWKRGGVLDIPEYTDWVEQWQCHPGFDWALIPDVIDGSEEENDILISDWPVNLTGVPVWHMHESIDRLIRLCRDWPRVALGSSGDFKTPNSRKWWGRMNEAMTDLCDLDGKPPCKLHGLRMLNPKVFGRLPLSSADSTNVAVNIGSLDRFGIYKPPSSFQRAAVIADRIETYNSAPVYDHCWDIFS